MAQLNQLVDRLIESHVEFVVVGGFAAKGDGVTMIIRDVDIYCLNILQLRAIKQRKGL